MGFGSISLLGWGLVAAVPIILHFLRRRKSRTIAWGAMRFLQAAMVRRAKRFQLWRLLLLLLRIVAVSMLALAVARPLLTNGLDGSDGPTAGGEIGTLRILILDSSYSMRASDGSGSQFDRAKMAAASVVSASRLGDGFLLMKMGIQPQWIGNDVSYRADEVRAAINQLEVGEGVADLQAALLSVQRALGDVIEEGWQGKIQVLVFSDLQSNSWEGADGNDLIARINGESPARREVDSVRLIAVDCTTSAVLRNVWVSELSVGRSGAGEGRGIEVTAGMATNKENAEQEGSLFALAQLVIDGRVDQSKRVELDTENTRVFDWNRRIPAGRHAIEVRLAAEDAVGLDNIVRQSITVKDSVSVALFSQTEQAAKFVELALAAGKGVAEESSFVVNRYQLDQLERVELGRESLWILCDPLPLQPRARQRLEQHINRGGGVVWWLGENWLAEAGGLQISKIAEDDSWKGEAIVRRRDEQPFEIDPFDYKDEIIKPFEPYPGSGLLTLPIFQYWKLQLGDAWETTLGIQSGNAKQETNPLIAKLTRPNGGREVIVATPPFSGISSILDRPGDNGQTPWNALIAWPAFVPLVQEIAQWVVTSEDDRDDFKVGEPIIIASAESVTGTKVIGTSGEELEIKVAERLGSRITWTAGIAQGSDVYRWADGPSQGTVAFVVNVDVSEGMIGRKVIPDASFEFVNADNVTDSISETASIDSKSSQVLKAVGSKIDSGWWFLLVAIGLLLSESMLVRMLENRF